MRDSNSIGNAKAAGRYSRRQFVRQAAAGTAAVIAARSFSGEPKPGVPDSARVFAVHSKDVCPIVEEYRPADPEVVKRIVREAVLRMGIGKDMNAVVRRWCPDGKIPESARIKIKFCGTRGKFPVHAEVVNGVVRLLVEDGGVRPENIHVYESAPKNFGEQDRPPYFGTPFAGGKNREPGVVYSHLNAPDGVDMPEANHRESVQFKTAEGKTRNYTFHYWDALANDTDILINIPTLKRHISTPKFTYCTISMKNHYGSIRDPYRQHGEEIVEKVPAVCMGTPIRNKQKLIVVDALYAMYTRGPDRGRLKYGINQLLVTQDMVAADYVGWGMLNDLEECPEPPEIANAARNGLGLRSEKWQDHVVPIDIA